MEVRLASGECGLRNMPGSAVGTSVMEYARELLFRVLHLQGHGSKRLRLCESLPLGERRFVAIIEFEDSRFLIGGTSNSLVLLAPLKGRMEEPSLDRSSQVAAMCAQGDHC